MKKNVLSLILLFCLLLPAAAVYGDGIEQMVFNQSEAFEHLLVSQISYQDSDGTKIVSLAPGKTMRASVAVQNTSPEGKELVFLLALHKNNRLLSAGVDKKEAKGLETTEYRVALTLPEDIEGCSVSAILWDTVKDMRAVCASGRFPDGAKGLKRILIDGEALDGFDPAITRYEIPVDGTRRPAVQAMGLDGGTKIEVTTTDSFPGKAKISTTAYDGAEKDYILQYTTDKTFAGEAVIAQELNARYVPVYEKGLCAGKNYFSDKGDSYSTLTYVDELLDGMDYISCPANWALLNSQKKYWNGVQNGSMTMFSFALTKKANIRVIAENACAVEGSFCEDDGWIKSVAEDGAPYCIREWNGEEIAANIMYTKQFDASVNAPVTVEVPNLGGETTYLVVVDYLY